MSTGGLRIFVAIATVGRADLTRRTVDFLAEQTRLPDGVVVVGAADADIAGVSRARSNPTVLQAQRGLCKQRNCAMRFLDGKADIIVFFDDDFVPAPDYLAQVEEIFEKYPSVVGSTGVLLADGIHNAGYSFDQAIEIVGEQASSLSLSERYLQGLYGCNMVIRSSAARGLTFDEALPSYGWQEDVDFTFRLGQRGLLLKTSRTTGVHLGVKGGRTSGLKLGYSQVANIIYLLKKGTMPPKLGRQLLLRNVTSNILMSLRPEPHIDRRGRAKGNLLAFLDFVRNKIDPGRIEAL